MSEETEVIEQGSLEDVKEIKQIVPATSNVRMRISKAETMASKDEAIKSLKLTLRIVDGIEVQNKETGEMELKYKDKPMFTGLMDVPFWADLAVKTKPWWKNKQYLVNLKKLCLALEIDLKEVKVDANGVVDVNPLLMLLEDREVICDIRHEENQVRSPEGDYVGDGTFKEKMINWRKA